MMRMDTGSRLHPRNIAPTIPTKLTMGKQNLSRKAEAVTRSGQAVSKTGGITKENVGQHRGRRKRQEVRRRVEAKKEFIRCELERLDGDCKRKKTEQKRRDKKKSGLGPALALMDDLAGALPEEKGGEGKGEKTLERRGRGGEDGGFVGCKLRKRIVGEETEQMRNVRDHAVFKEDPLEALRQHLVNSLGCDPTEVAEAVEEGKRKQGRKGKKRKFVEKEEEGIGQTVMKGDEGLEKAREEARVRVAEKKEKKAALAEAAMKMKKKKAGKVEKQTLRGLISKSRGRIGVKRTKILDM